MKSVISATIHHDAETWSARLLQPLSGRDRNGRSLASRAIVMRIDPDTRTLANTGDSQWDPHAIVHQVSDVVWVDLEHEDVERSKRMDEINTRTKAGWTFYDSLELIESPESERLFFTRPWTEPSE